MARHDRFESPSPWIGPGLVLAVLVAVLSAYLLVAWLDCSSSPGQALCALMVPPPSLWFRFRSLLQRALGAWLRWRLRRAQRQVHRAKLATLQACARRVKCEDRVIEIRSRLERPRRWP